MALKFTTSYLEDSLAVFGYYKTLAERAMDQVADEHLFAALDDEANSIAIIVKHMTGNMRSRWTDFLTTDGEKPDRNRDGEFVDPPATRAALMAEWENGWARVFASARTADRGRSDADRDHSRRTAFGDAGHQSPACALSASRGPDRIAGKALRVRSLAVAERSAQPVGGVQSQGGSRGSQPALTIAGLGPGRSGELPWLELTPSKSIT